MNATDAVHEPRRGRLRIWHKIALACLLFTIPLAAALVPVLLRRSAEANAASRTAAATRALRPLRTLQEHLALHRLLSHRSLTNQPVAVEELVNHASAIDASLRDLETIDPRLLDPDGRTTGLLSDLKQRWQDLARQAPDLKPEDSDQRHLELQSLVLDLSRQVGRTIQLGDEGGSGNETLAALVVTDIPESQYRLGQLLEAAEKVASRREPSDRLALAGSVGRLESTVDRLEKSDLAPQAAVPLRGIIELVRNRLLLKDPPDLRPASLQVEGLRAVQSGWAAWDEAVADLDSQLADREANARHATLFVALGVLLGGFLAGAVVLVVLNGVDRQVRSFAETFKRLRAGNYQARVGVVSHDELGGVAESLNVTLDETLALVQSREERDQIQASIAKLLEEVSGVAEGDLTKQAEVTADMTGAIADSFNYMIDQLRKVIGSVQNTTREVSLSAAGIHASADQLARGAEAQAEQIVATSTAIRQMAESIGRVSADAALSADVAKTALDRARHGNVAVHNTMAGMNRIRDEVQETAKRIKRLGESSQEIGQVVQLIDDIADRTSILALNASIQAAAAGDAGRGFAVVAEEVERLAVRCGDATKKIAGLVKTIQGETGEAVSAMEKGIYEVVEGSKLAGQAGGALAEIEAVSQRLAGLIQSISGASEEQARGSEALTRSMGEISAITKRTADGTKQTADAVSALASLADELRESVSAFRLPGKETRNGDSTVVPSRPVVNGKGKKPSRSRPAVRLG